MTKSLAETIYQFMQRVELRGHEVPAFVEAMAYLESIVQANPETQPSSGHEAVLQNNTAE
tara:strand:- start:408 stop:587 length:180 start_codon:yes stop_codon:yes gene_type:complete